MTTRERACIRPSPQRLVSFQRRVDLPTTHMAKVRRSIPHRWGLDLLRGALSIAVGIERSYSPPTMLGLGFMSPGLHEQDDPCTQVGRDRISTRISFQQRTFATHRCPTARLYNSLCSVSFDCITTSTLLYPPTYNSIPRPNATRHCPQLGSSLSNYRYGLPIARATPLITSLTPAYLIRTPPTAQAQQTTPHHPGSLNAHNTKHQYDHQVPNRATSSPPNPTHRPFTPHPLSLPSILNPHLTLHRTLAPPPTLSPLRPNQPTSPAVPSHNAQRQRHHPRQHPPNSRHRARSRRYGAGQVRAVRVGGASCGTGSGP